MNYLLIFVFIFFSLGLWVENINVKRYLQEILEESSSSSFECEMDFLFLFSYYIWAQEKNMYRYYQYVFLVKILSETFL